jgi:threonyl-tRNA synthetase
MLVVGDKEVADGAVAVRSRIGGDHGAQPVAAFIDAVVTETREKRAA